MILVILRPCLRRRDRLQPARRKRGADYFKRFIFHFQPPKFNLISTIIVKENLNKVKTFLIDFLNIFLVTLDKIKFILYFYLILKKQVKKLEISKKIKTACAAGGISEAELSRRINSTPAAFSQRLKTGKFSTAELEQIAAALGAEYRAFFLFPDGTKIE